MKFDELQSVFTQMFDSKKMELEKLSNFLKNLDILFDNQRIVDQVIDNYLNLNNINVNVLKKDYNIDNKDYYNLIFYQQCINSKRNEFKLTTQQINNIKTIFLNLKDRLTEEINKLKQKLDVYQTMKLEFEKIVEIYNKLSERKIITEDEFSLLCDNLKEFVNDEEVLLKYLKDLIMVVSSNYENYDTLQSETIIKFTNLKEEDLINLFKEFDIDFNSQESLVESDRKKLKLYGNLENIRNILTVLKENNIEFKNNNLLNRKSHQMVQILILSNPYIVKQILENIKNDLGTNQDNVVKINSIFTRYVEAFTIFIKGLKRYQKGHNNNGGGNGKEEFASGSYQNYEVNRQFFIDLGIKDINKAIEKSASIFTVSPERIRANANCYQLYGIPNEKFLETLTSLNASNPLDIIDQFLENGFYDYIVDRFSYTKNLNINDPVLYQLINARKKGWSDKPVLNRNVPETMFYYSIETNGQKITRNKTPLEKNFSGKSLEGESEYKPNITIDIEATDANMIDDNIFANPFIKLLENYKENDLVYNLNGVIISRFKVLRYFTMLSKNSEPMNIANYQYFGLKNLEYAIFKNTIITENQYLAIINFINNVFVASRPTIQLLDNNFRDGSVYLFNQIMIKRENVINNFRKLIEDESELYTEPYQYLFHSIIFNSGINKDDCQIVANCINKAAGLEGDKRI